MYNLGAVLLRVYCLNIDVSVNIGWDAFLEMVAEKICIQRSDLPISTFEWHWLKPASGPWLPVQDENGFASMVKKIKRIKLKSKAYVMVHMDVPGKNQASASSGNARDIGEEEIGLDLEESPVSKKVCFISHLSVFSIQFLAEEAGRRAQGDHR